MFILQTVLKVEFLWQDISGSDTRLTSLQVHQEVGTDGMGLVY